MRRTSIMRAGAVAVCVLVVASALISGPTKHWLLGAFPSYLHVDKLGHVLGFMALAFAFLRSRFARWGPWHVLAFSLALGVVSEVCQRFVPGRTSKAGDVLIDLLGACVGVCIARRAGFNAAVSETDQDKHHVASGR